MNLKNIINVLLVIVLGILAWLLIQRAFFTTRVNGTTIINGTNGTNGSNGNM